jgi:hypothetical protein
MTRAEYEAIKNRLEDKLRQKLAALEIVWEEAREDEQEPVLVAPKKPGERAPKSSTQPPSGVRNGRQSFGRGGLSNAVKKAVAGLPPTFTRKDLLNALASNKNKAKASSTKAVIKRLVKEGFLEVVRAPNGRTPGIYKAKA